MNLPCWSHKPKIAGLTPASPTILNIMYMKKIIALAVLVLASFGVAFGQSSDSKFENYVGYQFVRINPDVTTPSFRFEKSSDLHGINASTTYYVNERFGVTAELGANFDASGSRKGLYTAMGGATFKFRKAHTLNPFIRGLVGVGLERANNELTTLPSKSDLALAYATGVGLDARVSDKVSIRLIQADYLRTNNYGVPQHNLRLGAGIVF